jgi:hypothetical protein
MMVGEEEVVEAVEHKEEDEEEEEEEVKPTLQIDLLGQSD